jgi:glutamate racemase
MTPKTLGIFDSGLGGLTVARELRKIFPGTHLIYLGDTARLPYGTKSDETIKRYIQEGCRFLNTRGVDAIVIACNTMSALIPVPHSVGDTPLYGVIDPVARAVSKTSAQVIGILGTPATIASRAYERAIQLLRSNAQIHGVAAPLLVPLVEEGWIHDEVTRLVLKRYLAPLLTKKIELLILGCTHYPLLMDPIQEVLLEMGHEHVKILENSIPLSSERLAEWGSLKIDHAGDLSIYVTDAPRRFAEVAERFLGEPLGNVHHLQELK